MLWPLIFSLSKTQDETFKLGTDEISIKNGVEQIHKIGYPVFVTLIISAILSTTIFPWVSHHFRNVIGPLSHSSIPYSFHHLLRA